MFNSKKKKTKTFNIRKNSPIVASREFNPAAAGAPGKIVGFAMRDYDWDPAFVIPYCGLRISDFYCQHKKKLHYFTFQIVKF